MAIARDNAGQNTKETHPNPRYKLKFLTPPGIEHGTPGWEAGTLPITPQRRTHQKLLLLLRQEKAAVACRRGGGEIVAHANRPLQSSIPVSQTLRPGADQSSKAAFCKSAFAKIKLTFGKSAFARSKFAFRQGIFTSQKAMKWSGQVQRTKCFLLKRAKTCSKAFLLFC